MLGDTRRTLPGAPLHLFALDATSALGAAIGAAIGQPPSRHEERSFEDGEHKARPLVSVRGADVYVVQSLHGGPGESGNDKLVRLLFFIGALRDGGAARITAVVPYLAYSRKDRQTKPRDPVSTRYMAELIEAVGTDAVVTLDVHNIVAFQNAFRINAWHLDTRRLMIERLLSDLPGGAIVVASPDPGGVKRAQLFREMLEARLGRPVGAAFMEKRRSGGVVSGTLLAGDVEGAHAIIVDDMIASGHTMVRAAEALRAQGALGVTAIAGHGLFTEGGAAALARPEIDRWIVTDAVPLFRLPEDLARRRVEVVSVAPLFAQAIRRLSGGGSLVDLIEGEA
ncbi:ribose-phosphate pyrophosphokinase [Limibaculum sp. FT325]|uniref:ribose-phosphate diphosphokinase n=1 Tax=Thermohalobaculum sediminis TaxID=2939436 RepID=UPI0020BF84E5|nr:ribose-phosphate pyrophosphokinase [Limibaculum sediminis]MCL5778687.1 ribose-phosphate pyrophosphokinase [Limibaculum sediminis]